MKYAKLNGITLKKRVRKCILRNHTNGEVSASFEIEFPPEMPALTLKPFTWLRENGYEMNVPASDE
jgi:hypothetical protein